MEETFHTYYQSPLGLIRLGGTDQFISSIHFEEHIQHPPAQAKSKRELPSLAIQAIEELIQYFQGERRNFSFAVHQEGTPFQQTVWQELMTIPFGKTHTYLELARKLGDPKVIRAAAAANGKNRLAIVVPCHRVIGSKNDLIGYAGGLWRKRWLLDHEHKIAHGVLTLF